jgi:hypothetical protein
MPYDVYSQAGADAKFLTEVDGGNPDATPLPIALRRGTTAEWAAANPVLSAGEPGVDLDTGEQRIGDGATAWSALPIQGDLTPALSAVAAEAARADATFRPLATLAPLKRALSGGRSVAIQVLGDSTGNDAGEWPDLLSQYLAAEYPAFTVQRRTWSDATQDYAAPVTVQTGTAGPLYQDCSGSVTTGSLRGASSVHLSGTIDVRIKVTAPDWTPATARMLVGQMGLSGTRSWALCLSTAGLPQIMYSADGAAISMMSNSLRHRPRRRCHQVGPGPVYSERRGR